MKRFEAIVDGARDSVAEVGADTRLGIAPHSLRAADLDDIRAAAALMPHAPLHMHIAEQEAEIEEMRAVHGARPVAWLLDNIDVDARWCLIHCTHMVPDETERLAATGAVAGLCPVTEANLGDGIFDGPRFVEAGGAFGVGTDSNIRIGVAGELCQLEYSQRLRDRARVVLAKPGQSAGRALYDAALAGGARALGRQTGAIATGLWADLVALEAGALAATGGDRILDGWIFAGGNERVTDLWSAGRHVVQDGRHRRREAVARRYEKTLGRLLEAL